MNIFQDPQTKEWYRGPSAEPNQAEDALLSRGVVRDPFSGDYYQMPESSLAHWRRPEPIVAPQAPEPTLEEGVGLADYAKSVMAGGAQVVQGAGWLTRMLGAQDAGSQIEDLGRNAVDYWHEGLSDAAKDALSREFVKKNEAGEWEWGDATLNTVGLFGAQSLLGSAAGAGAGAGITRVLQTFANPVGRSVLVNAAQSGAKAESALAAGKTSAAVTQAAARGKQALKKLALVDKVLGAAGFGIGEGGIAGMSAGVNVYDRVMTMAPEKLLENPRYQQIFNSTDETLPELERHQYAAETVAREASTLAGLQSGLTSGLLGAPLGAYFGALFGKSSIGRLTQTAGRRAATGAAGEAAQEFLQGGSEQLISNRAVRGAGDTDVDAWDDVLNQALGGAVAGAPLGAALGVAEQPRIPEPEPTPGLTEEQMAGVQVQPTLALPAPPRSPEPPDFVVSPGGEARRPGQAPGTQAALPAPQLTNEFEVGPDGTVRQLDEAAANQQRQRRATIQAERTDMGTAPTVVPATDQKDWRQANRARLREAANEAVAAGAPKETVLGIVRSASKGETPFLVANRQLRDLWTGPDRSEERAVAAPTEEPPLPGTPALITAKPEVRALKVARDPDLTGENKAIEERLTRKIEADPAAAETEYANMDGTMGGKLLNTDLARELSPEYLEDRSRSAAVHEPASAMVKWMYERRLAEAPTDDDLPEVVFTAGGTGSGKTSGLIAAVRRNPDVARAQIVYDTNMNGAKSSIQKIEQALKAGKTVRILYTYRDPVDALVGGSLRRAKSQAEKFGTGRTVPITAHVETHAGASQAIREIAEKYQNDSRVQIEAYDNSTYPGETRVANLADLPLLEYDSTLENVRNALDQEYAAGRIDERTHRAFGGSAQITQAADEGPDAGRRERQEARQPQPDDLVRDGARPKGAGTVVLRQEPAEVTPPVSAPARPSVEPTAITPDKGEPATKATASLKRGPRPEKAAARVRAELKDFITGVAPLARIQVHETVADMEAATGLTHPTDTKGGWIPGDHTVHLVAENLTSAEEAQAVVVHEVFGHLAMERYPEGQAAIEAVQGLVRRKVAWVRPYVQNIESRYGTLTDTELAKEVIAHMAERGDKSLVMTRLIAGLRRWLRKLGITIDYSEADIREVIARSARALRQEAVKARKMSPKLTALTPVSTDADILAAINEDIPPGVQELDTYLMLRDELAALERQPDTEKQQAALRAEIDALENKDVGDGVLRTRTGRQAALLNRDQTQSPAFKIWFGDSKVTDSAGRPLRVFHGTNEAFDAFDKTKIGNEEEGGFFFTDVREQAEDYGDVVLNVYLRITKPFEVSYASWLEGDLPSTGQLKADGYDGIVITDFDSGNDDTIHDDRGSAYVVFEPTQIKSTGNRGTFDLSNPSILYSRAATAAPEVQSILDRVMTKPPEAFTLRDRVRQAWHKLTDRTSTELKQGFIDSFASIEALERGANNGNLQDASASAYKAALATKNLPSVMAAVMMKGVPEFKNGVYQPVAGRKGIVEIFEPLTKHPDGNLLHQWEGYAAARRASRLIQEKNQDGTARETLFSQAEIDTLVALDKKYPEFKRVFDEWQMFNKQMLDLAQEAGVIDPESRKLWERNDYVPFYRAMDEAEGRAGPRARKGVANQRADIRKLTGSDKQLGNVFENMMMNTAHLLDASFKNRAMQRIVDIGTGTVLNKVELPWEAVKFSDADIATKLRAAGLEVGKMTEAQREHWSTMFRRVAPKGPNIVSVMVDGKPQYYEVTDPLLLNSIAGMGYDNFADVFGLFRGSKKLLTNAITADPAFMLANFVRDTLSNWVISDTSTRPITDAVKGLAATFKNDPALMQMMMAGAGGGGFYDSAPEDIRKLIADRVPANQQRAFLDSIVSPKNIWRAWRKIGSAAENANRVATFRRVLANGGTVAEAAYQARDVLNFSMSGDYGAMRWLTQSVPFLNARVQGLYRLYRGARDNKKAFFMKGMMLGAATMALALKNEDDERYEELPEWDKDTYWHVFVGDEHYRIPKPFEVGAMFSTVPERLYRTASGRDSAKILGQRMFQMVADTFAFNPVPQLVKPIIEQYANRSMFTGSPIVGMSEIDLQPEAQYTPWTSETMRELSQLMPDFAPEWLRSPRRLEAAMRAYTGSLGMYLLGASDAAVRTALGYPEEPSSRLQDLPVVGRFWRGETPRHTKYADEMYEMMNEANAVFSTVNRLTRERRFEEAAELRAENRSKLAVRTRLNRLGTQVRNINNQVRLIQLDRNMDADTKRQRIDRLVERKNMITREVARYADVF